MIATGAPTAACRACEAGDARVCGEKAGHALWRCARCGALFAAADAAASAALYARYYDGARFETSPGVAAALDAVFGGAEPFRQTGRWLDVGFGEGALLSVAERRGWRCYGVEVSPHALDYGARRGWTVTADARDVRLEAGRFDVVTMIELLEHVDRPGAVLDDAARWLRPGGSLYVTTPNADSVNRRLLGIGWSVVAPPEHLTLWTTRALREALGRRGFAIERMVTAGWNPADVLGRLRSRGATVNRNETGRALADSLARSRGRRILKATANAVLNAGRLGDTIKVWARRHA